MKKPAPAFMRKLLLVGVVFSFALNGFVPRIDLGGARSDILDRIFSAQSTILQAFALTALPLEIVNSLMAGQTASAREKTDPRPVNKDAQNPSSDYSLTSPAPRLGGAGYGNKHWWHPMPQAMVPLASLLLSGAREKSESPPCLPAGLFALVLVFFFLLPRSGLSDGWARMFAIAGTRLPNAVSRVGFFISRSCTPKTGFKQAVAWVTLACFIVTTVPWNGFSLAVEDRRTAAGFREAVETLSIPAALGKITDARYFGSRQIVINIQDLHCHPEVQRNIGRIVALMNETWGAESVYQEGAAGPVDTSWLAGIQDRKLKQEMVDSLLKKGVLTGAESYSVLSGKSRLIKGLENEALYTENILRLNVLLKDRENIDAASGMLKADIGSLAGFYYNEKNRRFEKRIQMHRAGGMNSKKYPVLLKKYGTKLGMDMASYRNLTVYLELLEASDHINYKLITRQLQEFVSVLKQRLPYASFNLILERTDNFKTFDHFFACLAQIENDYPGAINIPRDFPQLAAFFDYVKLGRKLNPVALVREENKLARDIQLKLAENGSEREVVFLANFIRFLDDYLACRISADECAYVEENLDRFKLLWAKYGDASRLDALTPYLAILKDFYRVNRDRNACFLNNMPITGTGVSRDSSPASPGSVTDEDKVLAAIKENPDVMVTVMGGFHSEGFTELLRERGVSYLVVTPAVTGETDFAEKVYRETIDMQARIAGQAVAVESLFHRKGNEAALSAIRAFVSCQLENGQAAAAITRDVNAVLFAKPNNLLTFNLDAAEKGRGQGYRFTFTVTSADGKPALRYEIDNDVVVSGPDISSQADHRATDGHSDGERAPAKSLISATGAFAAWGAFTAFLTGVPLAGLWPLVFLLPQIASGVAARSALRKKVQGDPGRMLQSLADLGVQSLTEQPSFNNGFLLSELRDNVIYINPHLPGYFQKWYYLHERAHQRAGKLVRGHMPFIEELVVTFCDTFNSLGALMVSHYVASVRVPDLFKGLSQAQLYAIFFEGPSYIFTSYNEPLPVKSHGGINGLFIDTQEAVKINPAAAAYHFDMGWPFIYMLDQIPQKTKLHKYIKAMSEEKSKDRYALFIGFMARHQKYLKKLESYGSLTQNGTDTGAVNPHAMPAHPKKLSPLEIANSELQQAGENGDLETMLLKAEKIIGLTKYSPGVFGSRARETAVVYKQFAEQALKKTQHLNASLSRADLSRDEKEKIIAFKERFSAVTMYALEYLHALDYAANLEILVGYYGNPDALLERIGIGRFARWIDGTARGFEKSKQGLIVQTEKIIRLGNRIYPSLYDDAAVVSDINGYIERLQLKTTNKNYGILRTWNNRKNIQPAISLAMPLFVSATKLWGLGLVSLNALIFIPSAYFPVILLASIGSIFNILLKRFVIWQGRINAFYNKNISEIKTLLAENEGNDRALAIAALAPDGNAPEGNEQEAKRMPRDILSDWELLLNDRNAMVDKMGQDEYVRRLHILAEKVLKKTLLSKVLSDISTAGQYADIYNDFIALSYRTESVITELGREPRSFVRMRDYARVYLQALNSVNIIHVFSNYRISTNSKIHFFERTGIMQAVRMIFGIAFGLSFSKSLLRKRVQTLIKIMPGLYSGHKINDQISAYIYLRESAVNADIGMLESWKTRNLLSRLVPLVLFLRPIFEFYAFGTAFTAGGLLFSFATGIGLSLGIHWATIATGFLGSFDLQKVWSQMHPPADGVQTQLIPASTLDQVVKTWFDASGVRHPRFGRAGYVMYSVLGAPVWEEAVFRLPLALALQSSNVFGLGIAMGLSVALFSAAHVIASWRAERDKSHDQRQYHGWKDIVRKIAGNSVPFLAPSIIFIGIFVAAAQFLPFGALGAYSAAVLAHTAWNAVVSVQDSSGRKRSRWLPMASVTPSGAGRITRQGPIKSDAILAAEIQAELSRVIAERRQEFGFEPDAILNLSVKTRVDNHDEGDHDSYHLTTLDVNKDADSSTGVPSYSVVLGVHQLLWDALKNRAPPTDGPDEIVPLLTEHEIDLRLALEHPQSVTAQLFASYLESKALQDQRTSIHFHSYIVHLASLKKQQLRLLNPRAQRIAAQCSFVQFSRELVQIEEILGLFRESHQNENLALIRKAYKAAVQVSEKADTLKLSHSLNVARRLARWGADDITIAAAFLRNVPTQQWGSVLNSAIQQKQVAGICERFKNIDDLPYVDGSVIRTLRGEFALQNYLDMIIWEAGDYRTMLFVFAELLASIPEGATDSENEYRYFMMEQVYVTIAMRLNFDTIANDLRDGALQLHRPAAYKNIKANMERYLRKSYEDAEKELAALGKSLEDALSAGYVSAVVKTRVKGVKSLEEKLTSDRTKHTELEKLSDILGMHIIIMDDSDIGDVAALVEAWIADQNYTYANDAITTESDLGFVSFKVNYVDEKQRKYEARIFTKTEYEKFRFGLIDEMTINPAIPHWIYKLGKNIIRSLGTFVMSIRFMGGRTAKQSFRADNIKYEGTLENKFQVLHDSIRDRVFVMCIHEDKRGGMSVLNLPVGAVPADASFALGVKEYGGVEAIRKNGSRVELEEDYTLVTGDIIALRNENVSEKSRDIIRRRAKTPRAQLFAVNVRDDEKSGLIEMGKEKIGRFKNQPEIVKMLMQSRGFINTDELYMALAIEFIPQAEIKKYLLSMTRRIVTVNVSAEQLEHLAMIRLESELKRSDLSLPDDLGVVPESDGSLSMIFSALKKGNGRIISKRVFSAAELEDMARADILDIVDIAGLDIVGGGESDGDSVKRIHSDGGPLAFAFTVQERDVTEQAEVPNDQIRWALHPSVENGTVHIHTVHPLVYYQSIGHNVIRLLESVFGIPLLARPSAFAAQLLVRAFHENPVAGYNDEADQIHAVLAPLAKDIAGSDSTITVTVSDTPALIRKDAWALATFAVDREHKSIAIYVHRVLLDALRDLPEENRRSLVAMIALHEVYEYLALNTPESEIWQLFGTYIAQAGQPRTAEAFHRYIDSLDARPAGELTAFERSLVDQVELLELAKEVAASAAARTISVVRNTAKIIRPKRIALSGAQRIINQKPLTAPGLEGKTILRILHDESGITMQEDRLMRQMRFNNVYVLPDIPADDDFDFIGNLIVMRNGEPKILVAYAGRYQGAGVISIPGFLPEDTAALRDWLAETPQIYVQLEKALGLVCMFTSPVLLEISADEQSLPSIQDMPARVKAILEAAESSIILHAAAAVSSPNMMAETVAVPGLRGSKDDQDPGIGELTGISVYIQNALENVREIKSILFDQFSGPDASDSRMGDSALIDLSQVEEVQKLLERKTIAPGDLSAPDTERDEVKRESVLNRKSGILHKAYVLFAEDPRSARFKEFESFIADNENIWLNRYDQEAQYIQWLFVDQLKNAVRDAQRQGVEISFRVTVSAANYDSSLAAIGYWFRAGFDGVRAHLEDAMTVDQIQEITTAIAKAKPNARVMWSVAKHMDIPVSLSDGLIIKPFDPLEKDIPGNVVVEMDPGDLWEQDIEQAWETCKRAGGMILPFGASQGQSPANNARLKRDGDTSGTWLTEGSNPLVRLFKRMSATVPQTPRQWYGSGHDMALHLFKDVIVSADTVTDEERKTLYGYAAAGAIDPASANTVLAGITAVLDTLQTLDKKHSSNVRAARSYIESLRTHEASGMVLSGFIRGMMEYLAEARYVAAWGEHALPANASDRSIFRTLLVAADSLGVKGEQEARRPLGTAAVPATSPVANALALIAADKLTGEVRAAINPLISSILEKGVLTAGAPADDQAVIAELIRLFDRLAEKRTPSAAEAINNAAVPAGNLILTMLSAA